MRPQNVSLYKAHDVNYCLAQLLDSSAVNQLRLTDLLTGSKHFVIAGLAIGNCPLLNYAVNILSSLDAFWEEG